MAIMTHLSEPAVLYNFKERCGVQTVVCGETCMFTERWVITTTPALHADKISEGAQRFSSVIYQQPPGFKGLDVDTPQIRLVAHLTHTC